MRTKQEISQAEHKFFDLVWLERQLILQRKGIELHASFPKIKAAIAQQYPDEKLEYTDFEWGMMLGKLSALRWILGAEWDSLDT